MPDNHSRLTRPLHWMHQLTGFPFAQGGTYLPDQVIVVPGLQYKIGCPTLQRPNCQLDIPVGCQHDNRKFRCDLPYATEPEKPFITSIDSGREIHIQQDKINRPTVQDRKDTVRVRGSLHPFELIFQKQFERGQYAFVIINDQDSSGLHKIFFR